MVTFYHNLLYKVDTRIIINVDPVGWEDDREKMLEVCRRYSTDLVYNLPTEPHFGRAFKWVWDQVESELVFHLEDDWKLLHLIDFIDLHKKLFKYKDNALVRLSQFKSTEDKMKNWNLFYPWNGHRQLFMCPKNLISTAGFCGHPSLIKGDYVRACRAHINPDKNPEKQFHSGNEELLKEVLRWQYGVYSFPNMVNYIQDLGRKWASENGWKKKGSKAFFLQWERT